MATISATGSSATSMAATLARSRLAQAQREVERAQASADALRSKTNAAERDVDQRQTSLSSLASRSRQLDVTYERQLSRAVARPLPDQTQELVTGAVNTTNLTNAIKGSAIQNSSSPFIISARPQPPGNLVNVTA
jgi:multidrug resistance efflux pump